MTIDVEYIGGKYITVIANGFPYRRSVHSVLVASGVELRRIPAGLCVGEVGTTANVDYTAIEPEHIIEALKNNEGGRRSLWGHLHDYNIDYEALKRELEDAVWVEKNGHRVPYGMEK